MRFLSPSRPLSILFVGSFAAVSVAWGAGCGSSDDTPAAASAASTTTTTTTATTATTGTSSTGAAMGGASTTASTTSSSAGGTGGAGGSAPLDMTPIDAPDTTWTYVAFPNAVCMNGTPTGIGINKTSASDDVIIYMQGGNACFNLASCAVTANASGYGPTEFAGEEASFLNGSQLFDRTAGKLFADYNYVYVPYCTGDLHAGDNDTTAGGKMRHFHGATNVDQYLARVVATFPNAQHVVVIGESAGGFGALLNYDRVASAFPAGVDVKLLDDSGPPFAEAYSPACLQKLFYDTWGFDKTLPTGCTNCVAADGAFEENFTDYLVTKWGSNKMSLISSTEDGTISQFLGFGNNNCSMPEKLQSYPGSEYTMGLVDLRDRILMSAPNFKLFLLDGTDGTDKTQHVWLNDDWTTTQSNGVVLSDWLTAFITGTGTWENVPATGN